MLKRRLSFSPYSCQILSCLSSYKGIFHFLGLESSSIKAMEPPKNNFS